MFHLNNPYISPWGSVVLEDVTITQLLKQFLEAGGAGEPNIDP
jgi:hypothetical protein